MLNMHETETEIKEQPTSPNVLIVDDDVDSTVLLERALRGEYTITRVHNGRDALAQLAQHQFALVILDILMPDMDGLTALETIRRNPQTTDMPVMLVSALSQEHEIARGLEKGANDYITKPFDIDIVRARVRHQLAIKRLLDQQQQVIANLQNAHEVKDRILRIASHDLKNPLNHIRLAQFYLRGLVGNDPTALDALDSIEDTVNAMNELVEDFLDSSALEHGKAELELSRVEVEFVLWQTVERYGASANRKNITLLLGESDGIALADENRLGQIVSNLVSNAVKYSPDGSCVTVFSNRTADRVRICIVDEGPGILPEERSGLFQPFGRLSNRPTGGESSTGLGLWIVRELAELQNGVVGAEFPESGGSVFWVELPAYVE